MKIIISPAKKMNINNDSFAHLSVPQLIDRTKLLMHKIQSLSFQEAKALWKCNDVLTQLNVERFQNMNLVRNLTPAILAYEGLQYQQMAPSLFTADEFFYLSNHLRILSGFYGILKPFDGIVPYRLEMQAKIAVEQAIDLYDFWGDSLYKNLIDEDRIIVNLASKEYSQCIEKYIQHEDTLITIEFAKLVNGKVKQETTLTKMARGRMVRFMAEHHITDLASIKQFTDLGFVYEEEFSSNNRFVFIMNNN